MDLSAALRGESAPPALLAFAHNSILGERRLERFQDMQLLRRVMPAADPARLWTAVRGPELFLRRSRIDPDDWRLSAFEHAHDPQEAHDVFDAKDPRQAALAAELERYRARLLEAHGRERTNGLDEASELERLRSIGYVR